MVSYLKICRGFLKFYKLQNKNVFIKKYYTFQKKKMHKKINNNFEINTYFTCAQLRLGMDANESISNFLTWDMICVHFKT